MEKRMNARPKKKRGVTVWLVPYTEVYLGKRYYGCLLELRKREAEKRAAGLHADKDVDGVGPIVKVEVPRG